MSDLKIIKASEFKAKCLSLMDKVAESGQELIITKNHKPVAKLTPYAQKPKSLHGIYEGKIKIKGDIISPTGQKWSVLHGEEDDLL